MPSIAIIGAGPSGLVSLKTAVTEHKFDAVVFEKQATLGGIWQNDTGAAWSSMHTNLSKATCVFSDFAWDAETPDFPTQQDMNRYLTRYVNAHQLMSHIQFQSTVTNVKRVDAQWQVTWSNAIGETQTRLFDHVIIASGIFSKSYQPELPGMKQFAGKVIHSKDYRSSTQFKDQTVAVIGGGFSAGEIAADIASTAKHVVHVQRQVTWVLPRYVPTSEGSTLPIDLVFYRRSTRARQEEAHIKTAIENRNTHRYMASLCKQQLGVTLNADSTSPARVVISDHYLKCVDEQRIAVNAQEIEALNEKEIIFSNDTRVAVDAVVFCTGYKVDISFFDQSILTSLSFQPDDTFLPILLHQATYHPDLPNMAFVGMYRGPFFAVMELQARWAMSVFSGELAMPSKETMLTGLQNELAIRNQEPRPQFPHGDYVGLADTLAKEIGVLPDFASLKIQNPALHQKMWEGPVLPAHYRLIGARRNSIFAREQMDKVADIITQHSKVKLC